MRAQTLPLFDYATRAVGQSSHHLFCSKSRSFRLVGLTLFCLLWTGLILFRLFSLQIANFETWQEWALKEHFKEVIVASERGAIYDRNGNLMAVSVPAGSIYVRPRQVRDRADVAKRLAALIEIPRAEIEKKLSGTEPFIWIKRQIPRALAEQVQALNLPGIGSIMEARRYYPYNQAASSLIGMVGVDGKGLSGLEATHENILHTDHLRTKVTRDAYGKVLELDPDLNSEFKLPKGSSLALTLDASIQMIVDEELAAGQTENNAKAGMAVMIDADTGEILALGQSPGENFNENKKRSGKSLHNMIAESVFEPGSIMKPVVAAAALERKAFSPNELVDCEGGRFFFAAHTIKDVHPNGVISFRDVVVRSSNIGMTKIGMRLGSDQLFSFLKLFGFGGSSGLNLPGETSGLLRDVSSWAKIDIATHSFGQGVAVTPLQMVRAFAVFANGGKLPQLSVIQSEEPFALKRVISERAAVQIKDMLFGVVEDQHGTGKLASIDGVRVGGKTGTAQKARSGGRGYESGLYMASFVGFADASALGIDKKLVLLVSIDEPHGKSIYGGAVAAPVFKRIMQRTLHYLSTRNELSSPVERAKIQSGNILNVSQEQL